MIAAIFNGKTAAFIRTQKITLAHVPVAASYKIDNDCGDTEAWSAVYSETSNRAKQPRPPSTA